MVKNIRILCLALVFALLILSSRTLAQSSSALESRISRLETDNFQMRSLISRIESQLSAVSGRSLPPQNPSSTRPLAPSVPPRVNRQASSSDPMFNRLATLVIELKERIQALEAQVAELKRQRR